MHRLYVVGNFRFLFQLLLVEVHRDALQNLDAQNLDVLLPFLDVAHLVVVLVGVELRHLLRMDYFLDAVVVELHHPQSQSEMRMDYFLVAVQLELHLMREALVLQLLPLLQPLPLLVQPFQHRVMP